MVFKFKLVSGGRGSAALSSSPGTDMDVDSFEHPHDEQQARLLMRISNSVRTSPSTRP